MQRRIKVLEYKFDDFMRRSVFEARLDEFSYYPYKMYCRATKKILLKHGAKTWNDIPEMQLGKVFQDMRKALIVGSYRAHIETLNRLG
jgi:hypothetical protein